MSVDTLELGKKNVWKGQSDLLFMGLIKSIN